jgi:hypothetical protein
MAKARTQAGRNPIKKNAAKVVVDVEKTGEAIVNELGDHYDKLRGKVAQFAKTVSETTVAVKDKVTSQETRDQLAELVDDVEAAGVYVVGQINDRFGKLKVRVVNAINALTASAEKEAGKMKAARKKPAKRPVKRAVAKKKTTAKVATRRKVTSRKKTTARKAVMKRRRG